MPVPEHAERTRITLYQHFAETGQAISTAELATATEQSPDAVRTDLAELADAHHVVLEGEGEDIVVAHPFASRSSRFSVMGPDTL